MRKGSFTCGGIFDLAGKQKKIEEFDKKMHAPDFWENASNAQKIIDQINELKSWTDPYKDIQSHFENIKALLPEVDEVKEYQFFQELVVELHRLDKSIEELEVRRMLSGELDPKNCYLSINAGAGGTESCDWVQMLARMYEKWVYKKGWKITVIDSVDGEVAGIKSITYKVAGAFAYGYAKAEKGVHRLVRISPFDSNARRHTSFASVDVTPEIDEDIHIEVRPDQIKVDTFRSSGAGGQHVNTTDSAVRITHLRTGIVVSCQNERSQIHNRETCLKLLKSKLYEQEIIERESKLKEIGGEKKEISWGSQIRNYVFQPYTLVKDTRTKYEVGNIDDVMDGNIDGFIYTYLKEFS